MVSGKDTNWLNPNLREWSDCKWITEAGSEVSWLASKSSVTKFDNSRVEPGSSVNWLLFKNSSWRDCNCPTDFGSELNLLPDSHKVFKNCSCPMDSGSEVMLRPMRCKRMCAAIMALYLRKCTWIPSLFPLEVRRIEYFAQRVHLLLWQARGQERQHKQAAQKKANATGWHSSGTPGWICSQLGLDMVQRGWNEDGSCIHLQ